MGFKLTLAFLTALGMMTQACNPHAQTAQSTNIPSPAVVPPAPPPVLNAREALSYPTWSHYVLTYGIGKIQAQCERFATTPWCPHGTQLVQTAVLDAVAIRTTSSSTYQHFNYLADNPAHDNWDVRLDAVSAGEQWQGDCDDITSTTLANIHAAGQPLSAMWMMLVDVDGQNVLDHIIGVVQDSEGRYWVVGDTSRIRNSYPLEEMTYRPMSIVRMDQPLAWQRVTESPVFRNHQALLELKPGQPAG